ncbi:MAG: hypothetical protein Q9194_002493 [Teloschistes cf. exilis]
MSANADQQSSETAIPKGETLSQESLQAKPNQRVALQGPYRLGPGRGESLQQMQDYLTTFDDLQLLLERSRRQHYILSTAAIDDGFTEESWRNVSKVHTKTRNLLCDLSAELFSKDHYLDQIYQAIDNYNNTRWGKYAEVDSNGWDHRV